MFETFWVAPYDLRRDFPVLVNFERHARHASVLLGKIDFASASGAQIYELGKTVAALDRAVRQIAEARLFSPVECAEAQELVGRIRNALPAACAAGLAAALAHDSESLREAGAARPLRPSGAGILSCTLAFARDNRAP